MQHLFDNDQEINPRDAELLRHIGAAVLDTPLTLNELRARIVKEFALAIAPVVMGGSQMTDTHAAARLVWRNAESLMEAMPPWVTEELSRNLAIVPDDGPMEVQPAG